MIVEACGTAKRVGRAEAPALKIAGTTGTAYTKKGVIKTVIRAIRKYIVKPIQQAVRVVVIIVRRLMMGTKTGRPTSIDPPHYSQQS